MNIHRASLPIACFLLAAACSTFTSYPYPARLFGPSADASQWRPGQVVMERQDGALLFKFDDPTQGDHGTLWVAPDDQRYRISRFNVGSNPAFKQIDIQ